MSDITDKLRKSIATGDLPFYTDDNGTFVFHWEVMNGAIAEIDRLRQQLAEAREKLESLKDLTKRRTDRMHDAERECLYLEADLWDTRETLKLAEEAIRLTECPRPINHEMAVDCDKADECGCCYGGALRAIHTLRQWEGWNQSTKKPLTAPPALSKEGKE